MPTQYAVIARDVDVETEVRKSRFLARLRRVTGEDEARTVIEETRREHRTANHHCTAFVLGPTAEIARSNDDGEPAGTAGVPMLEVLTRRPVSDLVAIVTRYFGGVKLGAGGLVRAYGESVSRALDRAGTRTRQRMVRGTVTVDIGSVGRLENDLRNAGVLVADVTYASEATVSVAVPVAEWPSFADEVASLTAGAGRIAEIDQAWHDT
ncbi:MAG: YigZ family protein [Propionibacteriaceae bacterium]